MLKFGMIGGGLGSYIGKFHRWGAMLDDSAELVCGCFSRSMDKNRATAEAYHLPDTSRCMRISAKWQTRSPRARTVLILSPS